MICPLKRQTFQVTLCLRFQWADGCAGRLIQVFDNLLPPTLSMILLAIRASPLRRAGSICLISFAIIPANQSLTNLCGFHGILLMGQMAGAGDDFQFDVVGKLAFGRLAVAEGFEAFRG